MLKKILIGFVLLVIVLLIVVAVQPSEFTVTRSTTVDAPPATVFEQVDDFHKWQAWSPWAKMDPDAKNVFDGPASGTGAKFGWSGNDKVGEGNMTIVESHPNDLVKIHLVFAKPFASENTTEFTFKPDEKQQTVVTWTMNGKKNFISKGMCLFMNMDKMVGGDFEKGLASMKSVAEAESKKSP